MAWRTQLEHPMLEKVMRKQTLFLTFLLLAFAVPSFADDKHQSYFTYDDGGTIVRQGEDSREIEARVNMPIFPGDELVTNRRGRAEINLSDGNVIGIDRGTALKFRSMLDSYEGDSSQTIIELSYGKVMVFRTDLGREVVRLDTQNASYVASDEAIYSVEADGSAQDRVNVFDGFVEVRTPSRTTRLREGEEAKVDDRGLYNVSTVSRNSADDFERWFLQRSERYNGGSSRYLDRRNAYSSYDLDNNGRWVFASSYGWTWRPYVSVGWRPYNNGYWHRGRSGALIWVSYEPWGWVPYHYGRWAHDPGYGWVWLPGSGYAPAWVYWWYGAGYIGWAPSGWYDAYRPYYNWCYRPYARVGAGFGAGFYGRVRVSDIDLRPWTFVDGKTIFSNRIDRAALTTDAVKNRLQRDGGFATVSSNPARFTRNEIKDPAAAISGIARRGIGSGTGKESPGSSADLTPFFRRDPELSTTVRESIARSRGEGGVATATAPSGGLAPVGRGNVAPIGGGSLAPVGRGGLAPVEGGLISRERDDSTPRRDTGGGISRGSTGGQRDKSQPNVEREAPSAAPAPSTTWRDRLDRQKPSTPRDSTPSTPRETAPAPRRDLSPTPRQEAPSQDWRDRVSRGDGARLRPETPGSASPQSDASEGERSTSRNGDVSRRVIDRIGGARLRPSSDGDRSSASGSSRDSGGSRESAPPRESARPRDGGSRDSGGSRERSVDRSSPPPRSSTGGSQSSPPRDNGGSSRREGGSSRGEGRVQRDKSN